jgi:hypothetical protein
MSGKQVVGCCVHVTAILLYFGIVKNNLKNGLAKIESPAKHLINLLVNIDNKDKPNKPRYVKHRRRFLKLATPKVKTIDSSSDSILSSDGETTEIETCEKDFEIFQLKKTEKQDLTKVVNRSKNSVKIMEKLETKDLNKPANNSVLTKILNAPIESAKVNIEYLNNTIETVIPTFNDHIPTWGAKFVFRTFETKVTNTCTIDNFLFAFWVISKLDQRLIQFLPESDITAPLKKIITEIDNIQWDSARQIWYTEVMKQKITKQEISFFGTVQEFFIKFLYHYQQHDIIQQCMEGCLKNKTEVLHRESSILLLGKIRKIGTRLVNGCKHKCEICKQRVISEIKFHNQPSFLILETESRLKFFDLDEEMIISTFRFKLLCVILHVNSNHFVSIFKINQTLCLVDDLSKNAKVLSPDSKNKIPYLDKNLSSAMYYRVLD